MLEAMLYEHKDGRMAVSFIVPAPFTHGQPKWHRVGPVAVHGAGEALTPAASDVLAERQRQVEVGYTNQHDDNTNGKGELSTAAACYALSAANYADAGEEWPWPASSWNPKTPRKDLVRAAALILAEIERLDRATSKPPVQPMGDANG